MMQRLVEMVAAGVGIGAALALVWLLLQVVERGQEWVRAAGWFDRSPVDEELVDEPALPWLDLDDLVAAGLLVDARHNTFLRSVLRRTAPH